MRIFIPVIIFSVFAAGCVHIETEAQIRASNTGRVVVTNTNKPTPRPRRNTLEMSSVDFKNFTFPDFGGSDEKTFTLRNGASEKKYVEAKYTLRKTYYFDLTGDEEDEAVSHIIADGCQMGCEQSHLFYVHTADGRKPKLLWKIAVGGNVLGGIKSAHFAANEIVMEVFGDCAIENGIIRPEVDLKKNPRLRTNSFTRFVFTGGENGFAPTGKVILPLISEIDFTEYKVQINFGEQR